MKTEFNKSFRTLKQIRVLVLGDLIMDAYFYGDCNRIAPEASIPIIDVAHKQYCLGGAANAAANLKALGCEVFFCSVVGDDEVAKHAEGLLKRSDMDNGYLVKDLQRQTLLKTRLATASQLLLRCDEGTTSAISVTTEKQLIQQLTTAYKLCDLVLIADYHKGVLTPGIIAAINSLLQEQPKFLAVDSKRLEYFAELRPSLVKPNYEEAMSLLSLSPNSHPDRATQLIPFGQHLAAKTNAERIALTLDSDGVLCFEQGKLIGKFNALDIQGRHTSGAGDTFIASFMLASYLKMDIADAAMWATTAASIAIDKQDTGICTLKELELAISATDKLVKTKTQLRYRCELLKEQGKKIIFTNGCFDVLHSGHVDYLRKAKALGDILIIGVNNDDSVKRLKGESRPVNTLAHRLEVLMALSCVDYVVSFGSKHNDTPTSVLKHVHPHVFVKGGDYRYKDLPERRLLRRLGTEVVFLPYVANQSSTRIIKQMSNNSLKLATAN